MLIDYYKAIESSSAQMLEAAKVQDWDGVMQLEGTCAVLIEQLRFHAHTETLDERTRREKTQIMLRILRNDAQIRNLVEPWCEQIDARLQGKYLIH